LRCQVRPPDVPCTMSRDIMEVILIYLGNYQLHKRDSSSWSHEHSLHMTWHNKPSSYYCQKEKRLHSANRHSSWQFTVYRALLQANVTVHTVEHTQLGSHRKYIKCDCSHSWTHTSGQSQKVCQMWLFTQLNTHIRAVTESMSNVTVHTVEHTHLGSHRKYVKCVSTSYHCHNFLWTIPHALEPSNKMSTLHSAVFPFP